MSNPSEILDAQINAGWKHADAYDGDDRQDIKSDVFNAFQAGVVWERRRALEGRPSLEMAPKPNALIHTGHEFNPECPGCLTEDQIYDEGYKDAEQTYQSGAQAGAVQRPAGAVWIDVPTGERPCTVCGGSGWVPER